VSPFQSKGSRALRVIIAELAIKAPRGELLTYKQLALAIGAEDDDAGRARVRQTVSAARPLLLKDHRIALVPERGKGYRVARPGEFAGIAEEHRGRSDRALTRALAVIDNAPVDDMSPAERKRHEAVGQVLRNVVGRMTDAENRLADIEQVLGIGPSKIIGGRVEKAS
jgi:hypothetical protein